MEACRAIARPAMGSSLHLSPKSEARPNARRRRDDLATASKRSLQEIVRRDESSEKRGHHPQRESPAGGGARGGRGAFRRTLAKHALVAHSTISMARHTARRHRAEHPFPLRSNADRPVIHLPPEVRSGSRGSQGGEGRLEPQPRSRRNPSTEQRRADRRHVGDASRRRIGLSGSDKPVFDQLASFEVAHARPFADLELAVGRIRLNHRR